MPETHHLTPKRSKRVKKGQNKLMKFMTMWYVECQEQPVQWEQQESADQTGYRPIHIESLSNAIRDVHRCRKGHLILKEEYA